ncbi:hypothetical protein ACFPMF_00030 [Larkinella bovis]|uniref:Uncharacterized protein n=1 Tax=Larkinella bovis TaxID=683041 RepID=A0ABW0I8U3_9BACT
MALELKIGEFKPEYEGTMQFYLAVLNDAVRLLKEIQERLQSLDV